jgi:hypothetical protein
MDNRHLINMINLLVREGKAAYEILNKNPKVINKFAEYTYDKKLTKNNARKIVKKFNRHIYKYLAETVIREIKLQNYIISDIRLLLYKDELGKDINELKLNDVITFTINGREFQGSTFNENSDFFVNQNGENTIVIVGINGEIFTYTTFFENPHYSNMQSLIIPSIAVAVLSIISLVIRFLGVTRNES